MLRRSLPLLFLLFSIDSVAQVAGDFGCRTNLSVPGPVRREGVSELLADLVLRCSGGSASVSANLTLIVSYDGFVPRYLLGELEPLLLVDEPHSQANPSRRLTLCETASASNCNVYKTTAASSNGVSFSNVRLQQPGPDATVTLRVVNLRVDATKIPPPNTVTANATLIGIGGNSVSVPALLGVVQRGVTVSAEALAEVSACQATNAALATNQIGAADSGPHLLVSFYEGFPSAFRAKNIAQRQAPLNAYPADLNQNSPGYPYLTETGFFNGAASDPAAPVPALPSTPPFPSPAGQFGSALSGTRLYVRFRGVPAGMRLFAPANAVGAKLVNPWTAEGESSYTPIGNAGTGSAPIPVYGTDAVAVYEIVTTDPTQTESYHIPFTVASASGISGPMPSVSAGFGPVDASAFPRFDPAQLTAVPSLRSGPCGQAYPVMTFSGADSIPRGTGNYVNLSVRNAGNISGPLTVSVALPEEFTSQLLVFGWICEHPALRTVRCTTTGAIAPGASAQRLEFYLIHGSGSVDISEIRASASNGESASWKIYTVPLQTYTVTTTPPGLRVVVDGIEYLSPRTFEAAFSGSRTISMPSPQRTSDGTEVYFQSWSDSGAQTHTVSYNAGTSTATASAASTQCNIGTSEAANGMRRAGRAELVNDIVLSCFGGTPTPNGSPVPKIDIVVSANVPITSRLGYYSSYSEALLIADEPHSLTHPSIPLLACGGFGTPDDGQGSCSLNGAGAATYSGSAGRPNVFQGQIIGNALVFKGVPFDPPQRGSSRVWRIVNLRVDAAALGSANYQAKVALAITPGGVALNKNEIAVANAPDFDFSVRPALRSLSACGAANPALVADSRAALESGGQNGAQLSFVLTEGGGSTFRVKNYSFFGISSILPYPENISQNIPGIAYYTETGFFAGSAIQAVPSYLTQPPPLTLPFPTFPSTRGLNLVGYADSGTLLTVEYSGIPPGVKIFARVKQKHPFSDRLIFSLLPGLAGGATDYVEREVSQGKATVIYEPLAADDPFTIDSAEFLAALAFPSNAGDGTIQVRVGFSSATSLANPRFVTAGIAQHVLTIQPCVIHTNPAVDVGISTVATSAPGALPKTYAITVSNNLGTTSGTTSVAVYAAPPMTLGGPGWTCLASTCSRNDALVAGSAYPPIALALPSNSGSFDATVTANADSTTYNNSARIDSGTESGGPFRYIPVAPCRIVDTRNANGTFGGPALGARAVRDIPIPAGACNIPASARAYALNVTVVPRGTLGYLSIWPTGSQQPGVSTLNSLDGRVKANAAIVPAGNGGSIAVYATDATGLIVDINGYFTDPGETAALQYYPMAPCRVIDTRNAAGLLGGPSLARLVPRTVPVLSSACPIPASAKAYSMNATVVPRGPFGYLTLWPTGSAQPSVSTLNAVTGAVTANAAIVPAGTNGSVDAFGSDNADLLLDVTGYFAPPGSAGGRSFHSMTPCRVLDTRLLPNGPFAGPAQAAGATRAYPLSSNPCLQGAALGTGVPAAFSLNATIVPGGPVGFLTLWADGQPRPTASTLNALDGSIASNAAIVLGGGTALSIGVQAFTTDLTHLLLDINGYFR